MKFLPRDGRWRSRLLLWSGAIAGALIGTVIALAFFSATTPGETNAFSAAAVDHIAISPSTATIAAHGSQSFSVTAFDAANNSFGAVTSSTAFSITPDGSCTGNSCTATVAGTHTVTATFWGLTTTATLTVTPSTATQLVFTRSPGNSTAAAAFMTPPQVTVEDQYNNVVTSSSASVMLAINTQPASGAVLSCPTNPVTAASGVATFNGCSISGTAGSYTLIASSSGLTSATSAPFTLTAALAVTPASGTVGTTGVTLTGNGFTGGKSIGSVTFAGSPLTVSPATPAVAANGSWTATFTVPAASSGAKTVTATDNAGAPISASTTFTVSASLTVTPAAGTVGTTGVTLAGNGFTPGASITSVTFGGAALTVSPASPTVASNGSWTATFTVPASTHSAHTITATDNAASPVSASTSFTVNASATGLSPTSGIVGSSATIVAQGFTPSTALTVTVGGVSATVTSGSPSNTSGSATGTGSTLTFTIPALSSGAQQVVVSDGTNSATSATNFTVHASLTVAPTSGKVGATGITLSGTGYNAGKSITTLTFAGSPVTVSPATPLVGSNGSWSATFTVPAVTSGAKTIVATDNGLPAASAQTTFTVKPSVSENLIGKATDTATGASSTVSNVATTSGATDLILVYRQSQSNGDSINSITGPFQSGSAVQITARTDFVNKFNVFAWRASGNGTTGSVTINFAKGNETSVIDVIELSGNNTTTPIAQSNTGSGNSASASLTLPSSPTGGDAEVGFVVATANTTLSTPASFSLVDGNSGAGGGLVSGYDAATLFDADAQSSATSTLGAATSWATITLDIAHG